MDYIYLKPGRLYLGNEPAEVTTVLGSCVAATMRHQASGLSAICHALQPTCQASAVSRKSCRDASHRYVDRVIPEMVERFRSLGIRPNAIQVKLFGGAAIIGRRRGSGSHPSVGQMNVEAAMQVINALHLQLRVVNTGGNFGRKIIFNTRTGIVWMKKLHNHIAELDKHG